MQKAIVQKPQQQAKQAQPKVELGGGSISPMVKAHIQQKAKPKVQMGGGSISPMVRKHLSK